MTKTQQTNLALAQLKAKPSLRKSQIVEKSLDIQQMIVESIQARQNRQLVEPKSLAKVKAGFVRETTNGQYLVRQVLILNKETNFWQKKYQVYDSLFRQVTVATLTLGQATKTIKELINKKY